MTSRRRNDRPTAARGFHRHRAKAPATGDWLWGVHAVTAALDNPDREPARGLIATADRARSLEGRIHSAVRVEVLDSAEITARLPAGAVHQGIALDIPPPAPTRLADLASPATGVILMLDQVTDPRNVGAIFRCAAAFGARGLVLQDRHAPPLAGSLAKAAAGAIDKIAHARETNLSRALERLDGFGWRAIGLNVAAPDALAEVLDGRPTVLVVGSEGDGLRRLVREHCDTLASIPMAAGFESLNVAAAAAVALYEASRACRGGPPA